MLGDGPEGQSPPAVSQASRTQTIIPSDSPQSGITNQTKTGRSCSAEPTGTLTSIGLSTCHCIVWFMYTYSYLFCLFLCQEYCHRVTTQLQLVILLLLKKLRGFSPRANHTDRAAAAGRRS